MRCWPSTAVCGCAVGKVARELLQKHTQAASCLAFVVTAWPFAQLTAAYSQLTGEICSTIPAGLPGHQA